jgi:predicted HD phosphohydrolase
MSDVPETVRFRNFEERTVAESRIIMEAFAESKKALPGRILAELARLDSVVNGFPISVAQHCLQTATRAYRDGAGEEMVVVALLHDLGEGLCPTNHANFAADTIGPYVSEDLEWLLRHHTIFQGYYFFHHYGRDRNARDKYRDHRMFAATAEFCAQWDQASFDPDYDTLPLDFFEPAVRSVLMRESRGFI